MTPAVLTSVQIYLDNVQEIFTIVKCNFGHVSTNLVAATRYQRRSVETATNRFANKGSRWNGATAGPLHSGFGSLRGTRVDKFGARRIELAEAALETLGELGYARTSLREIAQNSAFTHGVFHYYFSDKIDLICCCVRHYKAKCVTRYDEVRRRRKNRDELMEGFLEKLGETLRDDARMHRLWYDLRSQALFDRRFATTSSRSTRAWKT